MAIYLDNAATSFPKPDCVYSSMMDYGKNIGVSSNRGVYTDALTANRLVFELRKEIMSFFHFNKVENVILNSGLTLSLNTLIKGVIKEDWEVFTSSFEHNSVLRPLLHLQQTKHFTLKYIPSDTFGYLDVDAFKNSLTDKSKLVILTLASNVTGLIQPLAEISKICKANKIYLIIDAAQAAGHFKIDYSHIEFNALAFPGHKALLGPQGIGGFLIDDELNAQTDCLIQGGTGSLSESLLQPEFLPDKFEAGTLNMYGAIGLLNSLKFINNIGISYIEEYETFLFKQLLNGLLNIKEILVIGYNSAYHYSPVISIISNTMSSSQLSYYLDKNFSIATRQGLHCAPLAHKKLNTINTGTVRFSPGLFTKEEDIIYTIEAINKIQKGLL
ncbi:MAG TPA: aminotransferase class V-fold PLP-dependent enzyme [Clostridiaceae bacterium]